MLESHVTLKKFLVDMFLNDPDITTKSLYFIVIDQDRDLLLSKSTVHPSASLICSVSKQTSWLKIWSAALKLSSALLRYWPNPVLRVSTVLSVINWSHHLYYFTVSHVILSRLITFYLLMTYLTPSLPLIMIDYVLTIHSYFSLFMLTESLHCITLNYTLNYIESVDIGYFLTDNVNVQFPIGQYRYRCILKFDTIENVWSE